MNSENHYKVTFNSELVSGADLDEVKANLGRLFKSSDATIEKLFSGRVMTIKKNISEKQALNYQRAMEKSGALAKVETVESLEIIDLAPPPEPEHEPESEPVVPEQTTTTPTISDDINVYTAQPNKTNLVEARLAPPPVIATDNEEEDYAPPPPAAVTNAAGRLGIAPAEQWEINEVGVRMSKPKRPTTRPAPNTDYIDLSPPKSEIGQAKRKIEAVNPDTSHLEIANTGARLSDEVKKEAVEAPDISYLNVAEIGEDMGQAKHEKEIKVPDTSQLSIDESEGNIEQLKHAKKVVNPDISHLDLE